MAAEYLDSVVHEDDGNNEDQNDENDDNDNDDGNFCCFSLTRRSNLVNPKPNVVFALSATRKDWTRRFDWIHGPLPCEDLEIVFRERKCRTPILNRIARQRKTALRQLVGGRRKDSVYASTIIHMPITKGDLANEEVMNVVVA